MVTKAKSSYQGLLREYTYPDYYKTQVINVLGKSTRCSSDTCFEKPCFPIRGWLAKELAFARSLSWIAPSKGDVQYWRGKHDIQLSNYPWRTLARLQYLAQVYGLRQGAAVGSGPPIAIEREENDTNTWRHCTSYAALEGKEARIRRIGDVYHGNGRMRGAEWYWQSNHST